MTKRRKTKASPAPAKPHRRSRGEIDRNYFFGDVLIKTGVAVAIALAVVAFYTPFSLQDAINERMTHYLIIVGSFGAIGVMCFFYGRHLRQEATHWDFD
jgi:hypothetical protein